MKNIGIDIDGVLCDSHSFALKRFNQEHNTNYSKDDLYNYFFGKIAEEYGLKYTLDKFISYFKEDIPEYKFAEHAKSVLTKLKNSGLNLKVITARSFDLKSVSESWILNYFGENFFEDIIFL